jgi:hypothetical protein
MILIVCCGVLLLTVPIAWLLLPLTKPQTVEDARAEVIASVEAVFQTLPPELILADEQSTSDVPCPTDDEALAVQLRRVIVVADAFDLRVWPALLRERFLARDGWHVRVHAQGVDGSAIISLRGPDLSLVSVRTGDTDAGSELTMTSWSSCTAA